MPAPEAPSPPNPTLQRARGRVEVEVANRDGAVRLKRLYQSGSAKAFLPRMHGAPPEVVLVNTAGGLTGGDRMHWSLAAGAGCRLVITTQAAERVYRSAGGTATITARLSAGAGACLEWLPQETILFDGGRFERSLEIDLAADARLLALETLVLGRAAMGETVTRGAFADRWRIRHDGRLIHAEALRASGDLAAATAGPATLAGARATATLVHAAPDAADRLDAARALLHPEPGVTTALSAKPGILILRALAPGLAPLRKTLIRFLMPLRDAPLPRVWNL